MSVSTHGSQQGSTTLSKDIEMLDPLSYPDAFLNRASINQTILGKIVAAKQEWVAARKLAQHLFDAREALGRARDGLLQDQTAVARHQSRLGDRLLRRLHRAGAAAAHRLHPAR